MAAWGARAIITTGQFDAPSDRRAFHWELACGDERDEFVQWLGHVAYPWLKERARLIPPNENLTHVLDEGRLHIRANAQASYGYLYVSAWMDPS